MLRDVSIPTSIENAPKQKSKIKIWVYSLKRNALAILFCIFTICLVVFSKDNLLAAKNGLILWATAVVPSLFPFFVATEMLGATSVVHYLGKLLNPIMRPLFGVPGEAAFAFIMGLISGYPVGAKIVANFMEQGIVTKEEAERMVAFTNNSGPLFIIGTVGITLFGNIRIGILLFITHVLACISVGIILNLTSKGKKKSAFISNDNISNISFNTNKFSNVNNNHNFNKVQVDNTSKPNSPSFSALGEILGNSIKNATSTVLMVGGFVVMFSVIISILNQSHMLSSLSNILSPIFSLIGIPESATLPILSGIVELTNGVNLVANSNIQSMSMQIIISSFLLGFGGLSVLLQVLSIISKSGLSIKKYAIGKLLQGVLAMLYTFIALQFVL